MIVVDASVAINGLLTDGRARRVMSEQDVAVPHLVDSEVTSALRRLVRLDELSAEDGERAVRRWQRLAVVRFSVTGLLDRVWELRDNVTAYDATYVAVAEALDTELLTTDARLAGATGPRCSITVLRPT
ncbi:MAG: type II toxin-antitoxin system VapC family toxin [Actinomycetota bacterium]